MRYYSSRPRNTGVRSSHWSAGMKAIAVLSALVAAGVGGGSIIAALTSEADRNSVDLSYGSVSTPIAEGEIFSLAAFGAGSTGGAGSAGSAGGTGSTGGGYNAVDVFARLNWLFARQTEWYGEYSGYVDTVVMQDVHTYKYYKDGMLISADITESSLVNAAREFCYVKDNDRVLWREAAGGSSTYNKLDTPWQTGDPYRNMTISGENGFKAVNGLPAFELSPYVIEPNTVLSSTVEEASEEEFDRFYPEENRAPKRNVKRAQGQSDGAKLYKATFEMNPNIWKDKDANGNEIVKGANAYYINQMIFTGGLPEAPEFTSLNITYFFDENWVTYATVVEENYSAAYGPIKAPCTGGGTTTYSYKPYNETDNPYPDAYEEYFKYYMDAAPDTNFERPITALDALAGAFGPLLAEPTTLRLDLDIGGTKQAGTAFVDLSGTDLAAFDMSAIKARVGLGALNLWVEGGKAYINYGGAKLSLGLPDLISLLTPAQPAAEGEEESSGGINTDDLLGALANGEFVAKDGKAELHSKLPLLGLEIPIDFYFNVDEEKNVTLDHAALAIDTEKLSVGADIAFGGEPIPALKAEEKAEYIELIPHIQSLIDLFTSENLHADLSYAGHGVEASGGIDIATSPLALKGDIHVKIPAYGGEKTLSLAFKEGKVYLDLGGIRIAAGVNEAVDLIKQYVDTSSLQGGLSLDIGEVIGKLLSDDFAQNIVASQDESKLALLLRGTKILEAFDIDFDLGDVTLGVSSEGLTAGALGASVSLKKGEPFTLAPEGYTDLVPYADTVAKLVAGGWLKAQVSYANEGSSLSVTGELSFDIKALVVKGEFTLTYMGSAKSLEVIYAGGELYLTVDGLRIKANVQEAIALVREFVEIPKGDGDALKLVSDILSLDFTELIKLAEGEEGLSVTVGTTALLKALGLGFDLGNATLLIGKESISLSVYGAEITVGAGKAFACSLDGYSEIVPYANTLVQIYKSGYLALDISYELGELALSGKLDLALKDFKAAAKLTLTSGEKSKAADILYVGGDIFLGVDNIRVKVNAEKGAELLGGLIDLDASGEEIDALKTLLSADFSALIPELWEADGTLHITLSSGNLLSLFGLDFDLGDLRFAVDGEGATLKLGRALLTAKAGAAFTPETAGYLDITDYLGAVTKFAGAEAIALDVRYTGENITLGGTVSVMVDGSAAKGDLTLTYKNKENKETEHAIGVLWTKDENVVYLSVDSIKVKANVKEALALIQSLVFKKVDEKGEDAGISTVALPDEELTEEEQTALEKLLSFNLAEFFALTEERTENTGTLSLTVKGTQLLSALGASFDLKDIILSLDTAGNIALSALEGDLTLTVRAGEKFAKGATEGYIDIVKYGEYLLGLFQNRTYKISATYKGENLQVRADVSFDTESDLAAGDLLLIYNGAAKEAAFTYEEGWFYLDLGGTYKFKAKTAGAVALLAGYLGLSGTEGVTFTELANVLDCNLDGLLTLHEQTEGEEILTVLLDGSALLKALGIDFDLGEVDLQIAEGYLYAKVKGLGVEVTGNGLELKGLSEDDKAGYTDLSAYLDGFTSVFKQDYLTLAVNYDDKKENGVKVNGKIYIDLRNEKGVQARADVDVTVNGMKFHVGIVYANDGYIFLDLDGAKIKADVDEVLELVKGLFQKDKKDETEKISAYALIDAPADVPVATALTEEQKSKLLGILETLLSLNLDEYFELAETQKQDALTLTVHGTELLAKLLKKDIKLGEVELTVEKNGGITLTLLGATITAIGSDNEETFNLFADGDSAENYADIITYVGYLTRLFESEILKLDIETLTITAGETEISASGEIDIRTDGSLAGGTLTLKVGKKSEEDKKSLTLTVYYEKAEEKTIYLGLGGVKLKASIEDIEALIKKLKGEDPATASILMLAATVAKGNLFGVEIVKGEDENKSTLSLAVDGEKLTKLLGLDIKLEDIALEIKEGSLGVALVAAEKFSLDATLSHADSIEFDTAQNKETYIDIVKYLDYAVELFRNRTYTIDISYQKGEFILEGKVEFDTTSKTATASLNLGYKSAKKHVDLIYQNKFLYITLQKSYNKEENKQEDFKFKANTASAVALILGYLGVSGTNELPKIEDLSTDVFADLFKEFDELIQLTENAEDNLLTILLDGTQLLEKLKVSLGDFELGDIGVQLQNGSLALSILGANLSVSGRNDALNVTLKEEDYTDLSAYVDSLVNIFKQDYITLAIAYNDKSVQVNGKIYIDLSNEKGVQARADVDVTVNGKEFHVGIVYANDGYIFLDLDGAKIKADVDEVLELVKGLFQKDKKDETDKISAYALIADAPVADIPATVALSEEQKSKLLGVLEKLLSLNLDDYFALAEDKEADALTLTVKGTELLAKLLKKDEKDIKLGNIEIKVESKGGITLTVLGATVTATGSTEGFDLFKEGDGEGKYADIITYVKYLTELFKSEILKLDIETLTVHAGETEITASGSIDIRTDGSLAGGTLTLKVGEKSFTLTLYYEKAEEGTIYLGLGDVKLKANIKAIKDLIDKIKTKEPAAAAFFTVAATVAEGDLFGVLETDGTLQFAVNGEKLKTLLGLDVTLEKLALEIANGSLGVVVGAAEKFDLNATLSSATSITFDTLENKAEYIDIVKYLDFAVDLFRADAFELGLGYTKGEFTLTGSASFAPKAKVASGEFTITYKTTAKHATFAYQDGTAYVALDGSNGSLKFKVKSAGAVALLAAYFGFSGTDTTITNTFTDVFNNVFGSFDSLFELSENAQKEVLTLLVDGTQLLEKLKVSLGSFELGDIGVMLGKNNLTLSVLGLQVTLGVAETMPVLPSAEELATYTDLSDYVDTFANLAASDFLDIAISYKSDDGTLTLTGNLSIDIGNKFARADLTITKGTTEIKIGIVYTEGGMLYIDLDGAKIKANAKDAASYIGQLLNGNKGNDAKGRARTVRNAPKAILTDEQKNKLLDLLTKLFTLDVDDFFTLSEEKGALSLLVDGTGLLNKLLNKNIELGSVTLSIEKSTYKEDGTLSECGSVTLKALGAEIVLRRGAAFVAFPDGDKEKDYIDILQYVKWAAAILTQNEKHIDLTLTAGELSVGLGLDTIEGNAFMRGEIKLSYRTVKDKSFNFIYEKKGGEEGWIYLDLDGIKIKAKTAEIVDLFKSLFQNATGEEAGGSETIALAYAAAVIDEAGESAHESFGAFSLTEQDNVLTLALSGEKLMSLLGEKVQSLLGGKFSLGSVGVSVSEEKFSVSADAKVSDKAISLGVFVSASEKTALGEDDLKDLANYIDVFKYGNLVKEIFASNTLQAEVSAKLGGKDLALDLKLDLKFKKDFTMAQGTLQIGSVNLDLIYVLEDREGVEGEKDVLIYVKMGEKVKLMANVSDVIRIIRDEQSKKEAKSRARAAAPIALTAEEMDTLEKILSLDLGKVFALKETLSTVEGESDSLAITIATAELLGAFGVNFDLGTVNINISEGELQIALPEKADLQITLYGTTRAPALTKPTEGYHDITPIVKRVIDLIEAQAIEFSGELSFGKTTLNIEQGIFSWKTDEKKFYLKATVGDVALELLIEGEHAKLKVGTFGIEFDFSDIGDLIDAVKGLIERVKTTLADLKNSITGEFSRDELVGSLEGLANVLNDIIGFLGGSKEATSAAASAKAVLDMGGMQIAPAAYTPAQRGDALFSFVLGKLTIDIFDESHIENRGLLGLGLTVGEKTSPTLKANVDTAVFKGEFPTIEGDFYKLSEFIRLLGYAGDAVALVSEPNLTAQINGNVKSTNTAMYVDKFDESAGLVDNITGKIEYCSNNTFPIHLEMDGNNLWVDSDLFVHFKLFVTAGSVSDGTNTTKPDNLFIDIYIADLDPETTGKEEKKGEVCPLDFFIVISKVGEGGTGYDPLRIYAPADEVMTILSGVAALTGLDAVDYVSDYLIRPWISGREYGEEMVARLKGLGVSLVPTILDLLFKDTNEAQKIDLPMEGDTSDGIFDMPFGDVVLSFKSSEAAEDGSTYLAMLGVTTTKDEQSGDATYTKTTGLTFKFDRNAEEILPEINAEEVFDVKGVDELILALARTATHLATEDEIAQGIAKENEYVRNDLFFVDGLLHLDLKVIGINIETINIKVDGLTVNFDANNQISLNAKLSYDGVYNALAGLAGSSVIIKGDTVLEVTIKDGMMYLRRTQTTYFDGRDEKNLATPEVIYRAFPLSNFMKDTATMMNNICFMFNLSEDLIKTIMNAIPSGGTTPAAPSDLGGLLKKYISRCTYEDQGDINGLKNLLYTLVLNGAGLTNSDSFGNITVKLGVEKGVLRSIEIPTFSIASVVNINAALTLRNPEYVFETGYKDTTESIAGILEEGMSKGLRDARATNWASLDYLEGQYTNIYYTVDGEIVETQHVVMSLDGRELYSDFNLPSVEPYDNRHGQAPVWRIPDQFTAEMKIPLSYDAKIYKLIFRSDKEAEGFTLNTATGFYECVVEEYAYGSTLALPFARNIQEKITSFTINGKSITSINDALLELNSEEVIFTANWQVIDYHMKFVVDGNDFGDGIDDWHYNDEFTYDTPAKKGYTFVEWQQTVDPETEIVTMTAQFAPITYTITLISDHEIEGFELKNDKYVSVMEYVYGGSENALRYNIERNEDGKAYILNGWAFKEGDKDSFFTALPNAVADNASSEHTVTLYAIWQEKGFDITFDDGTEEVRRNYTEGTVLTADNLPEVTPKKGYTGAWDIPEGYKVTEETTIYAIYTPIEYTVTVYSERLYEGFTQKDGTYYKNYIFTYDKKTLALDDLTGKTSGTYVFGGYYLDMSYQTKVTGITIDLIENTFNSRESGNAIYIYWKDSTVTAKLISDVRFEGSKEGIGNYFITIERNNINYSIDTSLTIPGYTMIGNWWHQKSDGTWEQITSLDSFFSAEPSANNYVELYAALIYSYGVKIDTAVFNSATWTDWSADLTISGHVTGGTSAGKISSQILEGADTSYTGNYYLYGTSNQLFGGTREETKTDTAIDFGGGTTFSNSNVGASGSGNWNNRELGAQVTFTMKKGEMILYTEKITSCIKEGGYTVNVYGDAPDQNPTVLYTKAAYTNGTKSQCDNTTTLQDIMNNVTMAERTGYTGCWCYSDGRPLDGSTVITSNVDIYAFYSPNPYPVEFTSENEFADCEADLTAIKELKYGTQIQFIADGATVANYTVGLENNIFAVPAMVYAGAHKEGYTGKWHLTENTTGRLTFTAVYEAIAQKVYFTVSEAPNDDFEWRVVESGSGFELSTLLPYDTVIKFVEDGAEIKSYTVKLSDSGLNRFALPEKVGYTASYSLSSNTGNVITVTVTYEAKLFPVELRSSNEISGWTKSDDGTYWYLKKEMYFNSEIVLLNDSGEAWQTFTVEKAGENLIELPDAPLVQEVRHGKWTIHSLTENGAQFKPDYGHDTLVYKSEVAYSVGGTSYDAGEHSVDFTASYTLDKEPTAAGYTFLGWYKQSGTSWEKVETLSLAATETTTTVEALWLSDLKVKVSSATRKLEAESLFSWHYYYTAEATISGGELIGAMAKAANNIQVNMTYKHFVNNGLNATTDTDMGFMLSTSNHESRITSDPVKHVQQESKDYYHCVVLLTYSYNGETLASLRAAATSNKL